MTLKEDKGDPRGYTRSTIKKLFGLSGNLCSFPGCEKELVNRENAKDSNICHIEAAEPGGERYRKEGMTNKQRADYDNLILLCVQHHDETNDVEKYGVDDLKKMKREHESAYLNRKIIKNPSMLRNAINAISNIEIEGIDEIDENRAFDIREKLTFNSVEKYAPIINEYKLYHQKINSLYDELEAQGSLKKSKILATVKREYLMIKGSVVGNSEHPIDEIRKHSDAIIGKVVDSLYNKVNEETDLYEDDIMIGVDLIVVDAFMRCKILEEPINHVS